MSSLTLLGHRIIATTSQDKPDNDAPSRRDASPTTCDFIKQSIQGMRIIFFLHLLKHNRALPGCGYFFLLQSGGVVAQGSLPPAMSIGASGDRRREMVGRSADLFRRQAIYGKGHGLLAV